MLSRRFLFACAVVAFLSTVGTVHAQFVSDYRTYLTFSGPVQLPGVTLPAGTYTFKLPDFNGDRRVVQVLSRDGKKPYAMLLAISAMRRDASDKPEVRFMETPAGTPPAIKTWWYPGKRDGWEFIYPRRQALQIAKTAKEPVLTVASDETSAEDLKKADLSRVSGSDESTGSTRTESQQAAASSGTPAPESTIARAEPRGTSGRTRLPQTAGIAPAVGLLGSLSLLTGVALRFRRRVPRASR